jgi:hypothetical protein
VLEASIFLERSYTVEHFELTWPISCRIMISASLLGILSNDRKVFSLAKAVATKLVTIHLKNLQKTYSLKSSLSNFMMPETAEMESSDSLL